VSVRTRVAVVGVGVMGAHHARVYRELADAELVAVVDSDAERAAAVGERLEARAYVDYAAMVARERPEAVSVAVPTNAHGRVAGELLAAGCHVLVEKPIAATIAEARMLVATAASVGRVLRVGHVERFNPAFVELASRAAAGEIGRVLQLHARRHGPYPARARDTGVALDLATHDLDLMRVLIGQPAAGFVAEIGRRHHPRHEDSLLGMVRFADDTLGVVEASWLAREPTRELLVTGQRGSLRVDYLAQRLWQSANAPGSDGRGRDAADSTVEIPVTRGEPLRAELADFVRAARGEPAVDGVRGADGADGLATLDLALALLDVARPLSESPLGREPG
jgi:UDP-N-acetylglucosamine 3-dehydrogenase